MKVLKRISHLNSQVSANQNVWKNMIFKRGFSAPDSNQPNEAKITANHFIAGAHLNPHYAKRHKGGEDAACLSPSLLCVADGVGGWAESGIDPAIYSKRLCSIIDTLYEKESELYMVSPRNLLVDAVTRNDEVGSCTCVIVTLDKEAEVIQTVNLGDSGYMILRKDQTQKGDPLSIIYESKEQ